MRRFRGWGLKSLLLVTIFVLSVAAHAVPKSGPSLFDLEDIYKFDTISAAPELKLAKVDKTDVDPKLTEKWGRHRPFSKGLVVINSYTDNYHTDGHYRSHNDEEELPAAAKFEVGWRS